MLINSSNEFKKLILKLLNFTLKTGELPLSWKESKITVIPKKSTSSSNPKDYRPISLTSCLAKLAEKVISIKLNQYLKENNLIIKKQSGFRSHRSTKDNIFYLSQTILESFNRKKKVCSIFFDIASAFDKVWHKGLIFKLVKMKIPLHLISWIKNFLENRTFTVKIGDYVTTKYEITAGVPQGAVLSPILFSIYINDIPINYNKNKAYSFLFADDLNSFYIFKSFANVEKKINKDLLLLEKWLVKWRLLMAPSKCNYLVFSTANKSESERLNLKLFNDKMPTNDNPTFLGIRFDHHLNFKNQVNYLKDVCVKRLNIIKILSNKSWQLNENTLIQLYNTLIRSIVEYSSIIYPRIGKTNWKKIEAIQVKSLKIVHKLHWRTPTEIYKDKVKVEDLNVRLDILNEKYLLNCVRNKNEVMIDLFKNFLNFSAARNLKFLTLLCKYIEKIKL